MLRDKMQLDEGLTSEEAEGRMKAIEEIARFFKGLRLRSAREGRTTTVNLRLGLAGEGGKDDDAARSGSF
jgi:hypothetical protein